MSILQINHVSKSFSKKLIIDDVSFEARTGEVFAILGPNGSGKTTVFYMSSGLVKADKGSVVLDGNDVTNLPIHKRAQRGLVYLPQESSIFNTLSVLDNIKLVSQLCYKKDKVNEVVEKIIEQFSLEGILERFGYMLSGGQKRRVEIARAVAANPTFILLDEPFAGIDPVVTIDIKNIIDDLVSSGIGVLITDHNAREVLRMSNRVCVLHSGKVLVSGAPKDIVNNKIVQEVYLGDDVPSL